MSDELIKLIQRVSGQPADVVNGMMQDAGLAQNDKQRIAELEAQLEAVTNERNYWRTIADDPGLYYGDPNPPYGLPGHGDDDE